MKVANDANPVRVKVAVESAKEFFNRWSDSPTAIDVVKSKIALCEQLSPLE